jgi:hypothetical protein
LSSSPPTRATGDAVSRRSCMITGRALSMTLGPDVAGDRQPSSSS